MRYLPMLAFLGCLSLGCTQDVQRTIDTELDGGEVPTSDAMGATGESNEDAGCEQTPSPAWCSADMMVPPPPPPADAGKTEEDKPDGGFDIAAKENGWQGRISGEETAYTFTRLANEEETCRLKYELLERMDADDCALCARAFDAVLGPVTVEVDEGGCGTAGQRAGETVSFGHGRQADENGTSALYVRKNDTWNKFTGGTSSIEAEVWSFTHPDGAAEPSPEPSPEPSVAGVFMVGELDLESLVGSYRFYSARNGGELNCEVNYPVDGATPVDGCRQCALAYDLPVGAPDRVVRGPDCQLFEGLEGLTVTYGHTDRGQLYVRKEGTWSDAGGTSVVEENTWRFTVQISF